MKNSKDFSIMHYNSCDYEAPDIFYPETVYSKYIDGQLVEVYFQCDEPITDRNDKRHWNVALIINDKKKRRDKNFAQMKITGKIGVRGLLFAKEAIKHFINYELYLDNWGKEMTHYLYCSWLDNRRRKVYEYGLKPLGFTYVWHQNKKVLMKKVDKNEWL